MSKKELTYEVIERLGVFSEKNGFTKEINIIEWAGRQPTIDIRCWRVDKNGNKQPLKGFTMSREEVIDLRNLLNSIDLDV